MKKYCFLIVIVLGFNITYSQLLFTETFNNYPVGAFSNDLSGQTPTYNGWYTQDKNQIGNYKDDYQIVAAPLRGNILHLGYTNLIRENIHNVFRTDLKTLWQQRTVGNEVFKISFDVFTQEAKDNGRSGFLKLFTIDGKELVYLTYAAEDRFFVGQVKDTPAKPAFQFRYANNSIVVLPKNVWVTMEIYIDYGAKAVYFSLPDINYTCKVPVNALHFGGLDNDGNPLPNDTPFKLLFGGRGGYLTDANGNAITPFKMRIDNINISAQNTVPVVNLATNNHLAQQFNLYPNPATHTVNITNTENIVIEKVTVFDVSGKEINTYLFTTNESNALINTSNWASGTYLLHLHTKQGVAVKKVVKK